MEKSLKNFQPMFGKVEAEWENNNIPSSHPPLLPFLFYAHAVDGAHLKIHVTDFKTYTWEAVKSVQQLEDLRDYTGIGCSLSDFINYLVESIKRDHMQLVLEGSVVSGAGAKYAKLLVHETKGMPLITISLNRLMDSCAGDAIANASWEILKSLKSAEVLVVQAQKLSSELTEKLHAEKEKNENIQAQLGFILSSKERKLVNSIKSDKRSTIDTAAIALDMEVSETPAALAFRVFETYFFALSQQQLRHLLGIPLRKLVALSQHTLRIVAEQKLTRAPLLIQGVAVIYRRWISDTCSSNTLPEKSLTNLRTGTLANYK